MSLDNPYEKYLRMPPKDIYFGSETFLKLLMDQIASPTNTVIGILGLPGSGKSSLFRHINWLLAKEKEKEKETDRVVVHVPFGELRDGEHPFPHLYDCFRKVVVGAPTPPWSGREPGPGDEAPAIQLLHKAVRDLEPHKKKVIFLFDDFHIAFARLKGPQTTQLQQWRNETVTVVGTALELALVNEYAAGSVYTQITYLPMPRLTEAEALRVLDIPLGKESATAEATSNHQFLMRFAGGHVSLLLHGAHIGWDLEHRQGLDLLTAPARHIWKGHLQRVYLEIFHRYWVALHHSERVALLQLANGVPVEQVDAWACASLQVRGLLDAKNFEIFSELFAEYLRRKDADSPQILRAEKVTAAGNQQGGAFTEAGLTFPKLTGLEAEVYHYLRTRPRTCSYAELIREIWQKDISQSPDIATDYRNRLATAVSKLRSALGDQGPRIENVRDQGYRLSPGEGL